MAGNIAARRSTVYEAGKRNASEGSRSISAKRFAISAQRHEGMESGENGRYLGDNGRIIEFVASLGRKRRSCQEPRHSPFHTPPRLVTLKDNDKTSCWYQRVVRYGRYVLDTLVDTGTVLTTSNDLAKSWIVSGGSSYLYCKHNT